jgi:formylmethanofuran--tetrahydromethanopterin N-formyltransferase
MDKKIDNTFIEAFAGIYCRVIVTADDVETLCKAASDSTATPSVVIGRTEGGVERYLSPDETPDKRVGAILQFWGGINPKKTFAESLQKFETELSYHIRQDILVKPFTAVFDATPNSEGK